MGSISPTLTKNVHHKKDTGHIAGKPSAHCSDQYIIHQPELQRSKLYLVSFMSCCYRNGPPEIKAVVTDGLYSGKISEYALIQKLWKRMAKITLGENIAVSVAEYIYAYIDAYIKHL